MSFKLSHYPAFRSGFGRGRGHGDDRIACSPSLARGGLQTDHRQGRRVERLRRRLAQTTIA